MSLEDRGGGRPSDRAIGIESEIGRLRRVVVHTPGGEIESMTPRTASRVLYNDIIPISVVSDEHRMLKDVLASVAEVYETTDLLAAALADPEWKRRLVETVCADAPAAARRDELLALDPRELVTTLVGGLAARGDTLTEVLSGHEYDLPPLPNLYFMRDSSCVIRDRVVIGAMAHGVRTSEALLMRAVFGARSGTPDGTVRGEVLYDGCHEQLVAADGPVAGRSPDLRLEGGDVLVVRRDLLLVGVSERTSSAALDALARRLVEAYEEPLTMIAVILPAERSTIHLDMIFTLVDRDSALVYEPYVTGPRRVDVYSLRLAPGSTTRVEKHDGLLAALELHGVSLRPVPCGGHDPVVREREQWLSAANVFAFAPGRIIGYDCNVATMEAFDRAGYEVKSAREFLDAGAPADGPGRLFVGIPGINLARGGGGPRCMTLPVLRDALS